MLPANVQSSSEECCRLLKPTLADKGVALSIDGKIYDPTGPMGKMFIGVLGLMAEFESDLIRSRTRDAVAAAAAAAAGGKMKGRQHKLAPEERAYLLQTYGTGQFKIEILCRKTCLNRLALYSNIGLARTERGPAYFRHCDLTPLIRPPSLPATASSSTPR